MANEAVKKQWNGFAYNFYCADATAIEKGTILKLSGDREVAASSADGDIFAGIAAREKVANDGRTQIAVIRDGIFDMTMADDTCNAGDIMKISGANLIAPADDDSVEAGAQAFGMALEAGSSGEVIEVLLLG